MTLIEVLIVLLLASVVLLAAITYSMPWIGRERMRAAVYDIQSYLQLTRIEAVSRNRDCRFVVDTSTRTLSVFDMNGTAGTTVDDLLLYRTLVPPSVNFARPDPGAPVTLQQIGMSTAYETIFTSDGHVTAGMGEVVLFGGDEFGRVQVFGAGGLTVARWNGGGWS